MRQALILLAGVVVAILGGSALADGTAVDQAVSLAYRGNPHWGLDPRTDLLGSDPAGDPLFASGWWYRIDASPEKPLPAPDSEVYADGRIQARWANLNGMDVELVEETIVFDAEGPSGGFVTYMLATNHGQGSRNFTLFHYLDADLAGSSGGDTATLENAQFIRLGDGATTASYRAGNAVAFQVAAPPVLQQTLNDGHFTFLDGSGLPFGPGDVAAAYQFGTLSLAVAGPAKLAGMVSLSVNAADDHVKGDVYGALGQSPLLLQGADPDDHFLAWMRRTTQLDADGLERFTGPRGAPAVGVDDFDGDFRDEVVFRDQTGVVRIGNNPIGGAPTLPPAWALSATGDFDHDGRADLLWRNRTSQRLVIWTMNGSQKTGSILPSPDHAVDANWEVVGAADFNGDGNRDLLWYNQTSGKLVLWHMNEAVARIQGLFTTPASVANNNWRAVAVGDYGKGAGGIFGSQDIVWQSDTSGKVVVWHMDHAANRTSGEFTTPDAFGAYRVVGPR